MRLLRGALVVGYPLLVFAGLQVLQPRWLALALGALLLLRLYERRAHLEAAELRAVLLPFALAGLLLGTAALWNDARLLLFVPGLLSLALLYSFARTLRAGPSMVETFARMQVRDLPREEVLYCRKVTVVWCLFFAANATVALWLALAGSLGAWTFYNGLLAYLLIGTLFALEFLYRTWRFRRYFGTPFDPLLRRVFPPRAAG